MGNSWKCVLAALFTIVAVASAQSSKEDRVREGQLSGYWVDPSTGLMWSGKDNGKDVTWGNAIRYCRALRLAGYSDWRLPTIDELQGIYDGSAKAPGLAGKHGDEPFAFHVKGSLFLTGDQWSSSRPNDDRGHPSGYAWRFNFNEGRRDTEPVAYIYGAVERALCVRRSGK